MSSNLRLSRKLGREDAGPDVGVWAGGTSGSQREKERQGRRVEFYHTWEREEHSNHIRPEVEG